MRTSNHKLSPSLQRQIVAVFAQTLADLREEKETLSFLKDFFTASELETFSKRLAIAYWLKKDRSYANIKQNLKVSSATIAQTADMSKTTGFTLAIKKIEADEWANQWSKKIKGLVGK